MAMKRVIVVLLLLFGIVFAYQVLIIQGNALNDWGQQKGTISLNETLGPIVPAENGSCIIHLDRRVYLPEDTMTLTITNPGNSTLITEYDFRLYRRGEEGWIEVQLNLTFPDVLIEVRPGGSWEQRIDLSKLGLKSGTYKVEKRICFNGLCGPHWAEFDVEG